MWDGSLPVSVSKTVVSSSLRRMSLLDGAMAISMSQQRMKEYLDSHGHRCLLKRASVAKLSSLIRMRGAKRKDFNLRDG